MNTKICIFTCGGSHSWKYCFWYSFGEIKFNLILKKIKFFCFFYAFFLQYLSFYLLFDFHIRKLTFFSSHFVSVWSCSKFRGYNIGWKCSFASRKWSQIAFKAIKHKKLVQKKCTVSVRPLHVARRLPEKALHRCNKWHQRFGRGTLTSSL